MKINEAIMHEFILKATDKFEKYYVGYSVNQSNNEVKVIIDDRDILKMEKNDLYLKINNMLVSFATKMPKRTKVKCILVSDISSENIWSVLNDFCVIDDVKTLTSFVNLKIPREFIQIFKNMPEKFKLSDFSKEASRASLLGHHRNTYQNWMQSLKDAGFLKLKGRTYYKATGPYKEDLLEKK